MKPHAVARKSQQVTARGILLTSINVDPVEIYIIRNQKEQQQQQPYRITIRFSPLRARLFSSLTFFHPNTNREA